MSLLIALSSVDIALAADTTKTCLQITMAANIKGKLVRVKVSFDGTSVTEEPITVLIERQTTVGSGGDSVTIVKHDDDDGGTIQATALKDIDISEPTGGDDVDHWLIHPQQGLDFVYPMGMEIPIGVGDRIGMVLTAPAIVNCRPMFWFDAA